MHDSPTGCTTISLFHSLGGIEKSSIARASLERGERPETVILHQGQFGGMHGLIHRQLRAMVTERVDAELWTLAERTEGLSAAHFVSTVVYEDATTHKIMTMAGDLLGLGSDELMLEFGKFWIASMASGPYKKFFEFTGRDFTETLRNLNSMHETVALTMSGARPPRFDVTEQDGTGLTVSYSSGREGLLPFVFGLFKGLLAHHNQAATIRVIGLEAGQARFRIEFCGRPPA